jgi:hypothetical protein
MKISTHLMVELSSQKGGMLLVTGRSREITARFHSATR